MNKFKIKLIAQSMTFYYESYETVLAYTLEEAQEKAISQFSKRTMIDKYHVRLA